MKSPFVRFSRFVRSPLSAATVGLCTLWGCRHLPGSRHTTDCPQPACAPVSAPTVPTIGGYEEPPFANVIDPNATEPPVVSLSEKDVFLPVPNEPPTPSQSVATTPESTPSAEPGESNVAPEPSGESFKPEPTVVRPKSNKPAPTPEILKEEAASPEPESPPKLEVPPEPAPQKESESEPFTESQTEPKTQTESKELASLDSGKPVEAVDSAKPPKEAVSLLDNEILSLDSYCDGLVFDAQGFGYVSHKNRIVRFSPKGDSSVWTTLNNPKGHRIEPEGTHLVCDVERRAVVRLSFDGKVVGVAAKDCDGAPLRAPYDIAVDPKGGFYFTDPGYVQIKNPIGKLHYVDRSGKVLVVAAKIGYPTGVVYDSVRQRVLVAESQFNRILEFRLSEPGKIESHEVLVQLTKSPDSEYHLASLCLDAEGNLYVTQQQTKSVHVFDPQGRPAGRFSTGGVVPSSVALRSPEAAELFLTGEVEARTRNGKVIRLDLGK